MSRLTTHAVQAALSLWILLFQWINLYFLCNIKSFTFRSLCGQERVSWSIIIWFKCVQTYCLVPSIKTLSKEVLKKLHLILSYQLLMQSMLPQLQCTMNHIMLLLILSGQSPSYQCTIRNTFTRGSCRMEYVGNHNLLLWSEPENASSCAKEH